MIGEIIYNAVDKRQDLNGCLYETSNTIDEFTHVFHSNELSSTLYQMRVMLGLGKQAYPMAFYDPNLSVIKNSNNFLPSSVGFYFGKQADVVTEDLVKSLESTMIFASKYTLQGGKSKTRAGLWTINFQTINGELHVTAVFGPCKIFPLTIYEIAGVEIVAHSIATKIGIKKCNFKWFFHALEGNGFIKDVNKLGKNTMLTEMPGLAECSEVLRIEAVIRAEKPTICPFARIPLNDELTNLIIAIHERHR